MNLAKLRVFKRRPGLFGLTQKPRKSPLETCYFPLKPLSDSIQLSIAVDLTQFWLKSDSFLTWVTWKNREKNSISGNKHFDALAPSRFARQQFWSFFRSNYSSVKCCQFEIIRVNQVKSLLTHAWNIFFGISNMNLTISFLCHWPKNKNCEEFE